MAGARQAARAAVRIAVCLKDNEPVVGFPWTRGSPIFRHDMPKEDSVVIERLRNAGLLFIGKTNLPEFAMGSHTYNQVYGDLQSLQLEQKRRWFKWWGRCRTGRRNVTHRQRK